MTQNNANPLLIEICPCGEKSPGDSDPALKVKEQAIAKQLEARLEQQFNRAVTTQAATIEALDAGKPFNKVLKDESRKDGKAGLALLNSAVKELKEMERTTGIKFEPGVRHDIINIISADTSKNARLQVDEAENSFPPAQQMSLGLTGENRGFSGQQKKR